MPKAIVGLGNPEPRFEDTRHNAGFKVVDALAAAYGGQWREVANALIAQVSLRGKPVLLVKPQTYMNRSGAIVPLLKKKGISHEDVLVVHDELEMAHGKLSFKDGGSARGHNGLRSLIQAWGTEQFRRLRFGIGRPEAPQEVGTYVLEKFENGEFVRGLVQGAVELIEDLFEDVDIV